MSALLDLFAAPSQQLGLTSGASSGQQTGSGIGTLLSSGINYQQPNATLPLTIPATNSQLDPKQQFRINQAMQDLGRMRAAQGKTAFGNYLQKNQSNYDNQFGQVNSQNALQQLQGRMGFNDSMFSMDQQQQQVGQGMFNELLSPLFSILQNEGGLKVF